MVIWCVCVDNNHLSSFPCILALTNHFFNLASLAFQKDSIRSRLRLFLHLAATFNLNNMSSYTSRPKATLAKAPPKNPPLKILFPSLSLSIKPDENTFLASK